MTILSRVLERTETDITDTELQSMIDEITAEIVGRFGLNASITVYLGGDREILRDRRFLTLIRPYASAMVITEIDGTTETVLSPDDFRILHRGRTLERLLEGTNGAEFWERLVQVVYTPLSDAAEREEVTILLVTLGLEYRGLKSEKAGDYTMTAKEYNDERGKQLDRLAPRSGMVLA
ncbi:hypothetical protein LCGC14_1405390 [marine sediment metagenome]|uniref:Uncharacterized protein n=1 Tax=marine sediment metagenome TaxID=412755 RepID=A0A0F9JVU6_9ZZZZ